MFLIGEEQILFGQEADRDPDPTIATRTTGGRSSRFSRSPVDKSTILPSPSMPASPISSGA